MHTKLFLLFAFASVVSSHDISIGSDTEGRKIFDEIRQANPAIWRQTENVTIIAPNDEVISRVVVTDMRPEKDGDVQIVDGGERKKSVTIELKSPTVLRGYEFHLEVYSVPETKLTDGEEHISDPALTTDKTNVPENSETTSHETDGSGDDVKDSEMPDNEGKTTGNSESSTSKDIPASVGIVDDDILRPARKTNDENVTPQMYQSEENSNLHPSIIASEPDATTTENVKTKIDVSEEVTTEAETITKLNENEEITDAPESFDNSKNIPDYPALSILDLIKSKEGARRIRHTEDETNESNHDATTTEDIVQSTESIDTSYTSLPVEESSASSHNSDDTFDLVPPEETDYNTGFSSNNENTEKPLEASTVNNRPRAGRGLDVDDLQEQSVPTSTSTIEITTSDDENSENSTTEATIDEQSRNTRDARKDDGSNDSNGLDDSTQNGQMPLCGAVPNGSDKPSNGLKANVIVLNGEQLTLTPDITKMQFGIPIVLIIGSDTNIPTIKIITEDANNNHENKDVNIQPPEGFLEENVPVPEDKLNDYPQVENDGASENDFVPNPVTSLN